MKLLYLVLDGMADRLSDPETTLEKAEKPGLDTIAREGVCGAMYVIEKGVAPESDAAVISILGYKPYKYYTGRGPIEALGANMEFREGWDVVFRANFATIDPSTRRLIDRRVGRKLSTEEARELAEAVDGLELGDGCVARVKATIGHRAVVVISCRDKKLSPLIDNNDPAYKRKGLISIAVENPSPYIEEIKPLEDTLEAREAARLANLFTEKAIEILDRHPVNKARREKGLLPANAILLRDAGNLKPRAPSLSEKYGLRFALIAEMPVELGIGRAFGAHVREVPPPTDEPASDYRVRLEHTLALLRDYDVVYVHLKGPDEPGHDGDIELKKKRIEEIDKYYVRPLLEWKPEDLAILVTADHATPPSARAHTDDPVPIAFYAPGIEPDKVQVFTEKNCINGSLGVLDHGWLLLPRIIEIIKSQ